MSTEPTEHERIPAEETAPRDEGHHLHLHISKEQRKGIIIVFAVFLISILVLMLYLMDRSEDLLRHSPEHYFASFREVAAMDDMDVNISAYYKEDGKKHVCVFDKTEKLTYCYELSDDHGKIVVDRSYRRSDLPYTTTLP